MAYKEQICDTEAFSSIKQHVFIPALVGNEKQIHILHKACIPHMALCFEEGLGKEVSKFLVNC
jgi:hypothetical protein